MIEFKRFIETFNRGSFNPVHGEVLLELIKEAKPFLISSQFVYGGGGAQLDREETKELFNADSPGDKMKELYEKKGIVEPEIEGVLNLPFKTCWFEYYGKDSEPCLVGTAGNDGTKMIFSGWLVHEVEPDKYFVAIMTQL